MDGSHSLPSRAGSRSRKFFFRGLAIVLPTVLTIWILMAAYQFVVNRIAAPINDGIKIAVVTLTDWPEPTADDYDDAFRNLSERQKSAWQIETEQLKNRYGTAYTASVEAQERREWMRQNPMGSKIAQRAALESRWQAVTIGNWRVMNVIGLIVAIALIYIIGVLLGSYIGRRLYSRGEEWITRVPLIRRVYPSVKQVTDFFVGESRDGAMTFNRVVAVQYPRKGIWSVGLVTGDTMRLIQDSAGDECLTVFVPSSPTPFTGYVITVPKRETVDLPVSIEDALKFAVSLGVLVPPSQQLHPAAAPDAQPGLSPGALAVSGASGNGAAEQNNENSHGQTSAGPDPSASATPEQMRKQPMETTVTGKHLEITDAIRDYAVDKAQRFPRFFNRVSAVEVVIDKSEPPHYNVEMIVHVDGHDHFVASADHRDLYACIDQASDKVERQLHDHKERLRNPKHKSRQR